MSTQAIIEINGQRFNALTGKLLAAAAPKQRNIDGILPAADAPAFLAAAAKLERRRVSHIVRGPLIDNVLTSPNHWQGHKPQPARTLKRTAVKKPSALLSAKIRVQAPQAHAAAITVRPKTSVYRVPADRLARAAQANMSPFVTRFAGGYTPVLAIAAEPAPLRVPAAAPASAQPLTTSQLLTQALQYARSHEEPVLGKKPRLSQRALVITASFAAFLVMVGTLASTSINSTRIHLASANAGFAVSAPQQTVSGFHLGNVSSSAGVVATNYLSNSDQRSYTLTQQPSSWDDQTLRSRFLQSNAGGYQTTVSGGHTVYLYGNGNATWLNGGLWYRMVSNGSLSDRQIADIVAGL